MRTFIALLVFLLNGYYSPYAQKVLSLQYERSAVNFFLDSIIKSSYPKVKTLYYEKYIKNERSVLLATAKGFDHYNKRMDSLEKGSVILIHDSISKTDFSDSLVAPNYNSYRAFKVKEWKREKKLKETELLLRIYKKNIYRSDFFVIQIIVYNNSLKDHYFFEFNSITQQMTRFSSVKYDF